MKSGKYIVYEDGDCQVFDAIKDHDHVALHHRGTPVSAGFFRVSDEGETRAYGQSITLGLSSKDGDVEKVKVALSNL